MRLLASSVSAFAITATAAVAGMGIETFDRNGDRFVSYAELSAVLPSVTKSDFNRLDTNDDRRLGSNEVSSAGAEAVFGRHLEVTNEVRGLSEVDTNGDRFASYAEMVSAHPGFHRTDFNEIDTNDDRRISQSELYDGNAQSILTRYERGSKILVSLDEIDIDGSGFATMPELATRYPGMSVNDFHRIDTNKDNRISFSELYDLETISILGGKL